MEFKFAFVHNKGKQILSHFQAVLDGINDGIFNSDAKGNIIMVNQSIIAATNKRLKDMVKTGFFYIIGSVLPR